MKSTFYLRRVKRLLDIALAMVLLLGLSPLLLLIALAIKLDSRGPILFRHERVGRDGMPFKLTKFRSMAVGAEHQGAGALVERHDTRITRVGRLIRKISLDELPQFFDVLAGTMSVVGPRPGLQYQVDQYSKEQRRRLLVQPGVTGWAQVHGRNSINWEQRIRLDLVYLDRVSLWTDVLVLLRTLPAVLVGADQIASGDYWRERSKQNPPPDDTGGDTGRSSSVVGPEGSSGP